MEKNMLSQKIARLKSMLKVDFRRAFTSPLAYIMIGAALVVPVLILVMTTMMDGSVSVNPQTGEQTVMQGFTSVWQIIGSLSSAGMSGGMDLVAMCNINLVFFAVAVFTCIFTADDFRSGYAKNIFTVRAKKGAYVASKTVISFVIGAAMVLAFLLGAMVGGAIVGLPFKLSGFSAGNLIACIVSKIGLVMMFAAVYVVAAVTAKSRLWLSILLSLGIGMLFFTVAPMISPLDAGALNLILSVVGGAIFAVGLGAVSNLILSKTALV